MTVTQILVSLTTLSAPQYRFFRDPALRLVAILAALLVYAYELTGFTLSIDEEVLAYNTTLPLNWIGQGRWSMALITWLLPQHASLPLVSTLVFCLGLAASALLLAGCFARSRVEAVAFVLLFASSPIWPHVVEFNQLAAGFGIGLLFAALGLAAMQQPGAAGAIVGGIAASVAVGIHQSLLAVFLVGAMFTLVQTVEDDRSGRAGWWGRRAVGIALLALSLVIAIALYMGATYAALWITAQPLTHVDNSLRIGELLLPGEAAPAIARMLVRVEGLVLGSDPTFLGWGAAALAIAWLGAAAGTWRLLARITEAPGATLAAAILLVGVFLAALAPIVGSVGYADTRSLGSLALVHALAGAAAFRLSPTLRALGWLLLAYAFVVNVWICTSLFYADALARDRDRILATSIAQRLDLLRPADGSDLKFTVVGAWRHEEAGPAHHVQVFGTSFFEHDGGSVWRIHRYFELLGIGHIAPVDIAALKDSMETVEQMPAWPAAGSVAMVGDTAVIKLGPLSDQQRGRLGQ